MSKRPPTAAPLFWGRAVSKVSRSQKLVRNGWFERFSKIGPSGPILTFLGSIFIDFSWQRQILGLVLRKNAKKYTKIAKNRENCQNLVVFWKNLPTVRRYLIFLKAVPDSIDLITSRFGYLFHGHQNLIQWRKHWIEFWCPWKRHPNLDVIRSIESGTAFRKIEFRRTVGRFFQKTVWKIIKNCSK